MSTSLAAYVPTTADAELMDTLEAKIDSIAQTDINRLVDIANNIAVMLAQFGPNSRVHYVLNWIYDTIVVVVDAEKAARAETMMHSDMDMSDDTAMEMEDTTDTTMDAEDTDDSTDTATGANILVQMTGTNYVYSMDEIYVSVWDTVTIEFESVDGFHDVVIDEYGSTEQVWVWDGMTSMTFVADTVGEFDYYCSVGTHRAQGMVGVLVVE